MGLWGSVLLLTGLSAWQPIPEYPVYLSVNADASVYGVALLLALLSGLLFGAVPVRQVFRTDPYGVIKSGSTGTLGGGFGRRMTARDLLLGAQIAICAVLVTSSLVAVRGMVRSLHRHFGFEPQNTDARRDRSQYGRLPRFAHSDLLCLAQHDFRHRFHRIGMKVHARSIFEWACR